ncbi:hypothetical protein MIB92_02895 [Aestuariirhabdus sp. Z084]|uniref:hypothetical protein n=1 Tax=Aestuariirhabdus haliotis TaxID=2918751 RepID=UPI0020BE84AE|nr:hypothetical protein [Aestuariirhabdus haliotis]MCL6414586.1 hypothetical protein [Aestuariirhabdus haliotis]MCL6418432.1 hypothetical protein [Aestuariirhabdus haliotis]
MKPHPYDKRAIQGYEQKQEVADYGTETSADINREQFKQAYAFMLTGAINPPNLLVFGSITFRNI